MRNEWLIKSSRSCVIFVARKFVIAALVSVLAVSGFAKMYEEPKSFSLKEAAQDQEKVQVKIMPKVDAERLQADDKARLRDPQHPGPKRFAVAVAAAFTLDNSGTWQTLADGRIWRLRIQSPGAKSHNLGFTRFEMPEGAKMWVYDPKHTHVEGPYTSRHRSQKGSLWTPVIEGDQIVVELFVPDGVSQPVVLIGRVNQGYYGGAQAGLFGSSEGTCEIDVICSQGDPWRNQIRAVAVYTISNDFGSGACTGTLLNDVPQDRRAFFLSANHCLENNGDPASVVVFWNFQAGVCGTHGPGPLTNSQTGSTLRANNAASDFMLLELSQRPEDAGFNVFHAGWDATGVAPPSTVAIHHPMADVKAISLSNTAPQSADWTGALPNGGVLDATGNHWQVVWDVAGTESGSSGACLFSTTTGRCIGQNHGGEAACVTANPVNYYGKFGVSWTGGGTSSTRLSDWLDPGTTGTLAIDGDPHITTINGVHYDFQGAGEFISLRAPDGTEIQTRQAPIATTFSPGPDTHDGLATCVSLNTAVAARVGKHRVTYEPNLSGVPDPSGLQLRVDGYLTALGPTEHDLGDGGRLSQTAAPGGLQIDFPDRSTLVVTPGWWADQSKWYLNVDLTRTPATDGVGTDAGSLSTGGIAGAITQGNWLPALPDGTAMGPMPTSLHDRYVDLYQKFANAWRVTNKSSLFDYLPGTSTETFTMLDWPLERPPCLIPETKPAKPVTELVAQRACRAITNKNTHSNCVFDVMVTGNLGLADTYFGAQHILADSTGTTVTDDENPTQVGESVTFTAVVSRTAPTGVGVPVGTVQFTLDGNKVGTPVNIDSEGRATWETSRLQVGTHAVSGRYIPGPSSTFLASSSRDESHTVKRCPCARDK
jgi:lysyl endopeptidase